MERGVYFYQLGFINFSYVLWIRMWIFYIFFAQGWKPTWWTPLISSHLPATIPGQVFFVLLNRDTQTPNEKTNWFWHLWPYCNLEVGLADLRSSKHKRHPKTKYLHRRLKKPMHLRWVTLQIMAKMYLLPFLCIARESSGIGSYFYSYIVTFPYCFFFSGIHVQRFQCWHLTFTHSIWTAQRCLFHRLRILD